jgi:Flp pilus assembly protein TadD
MTSTASTRMIGFAVTTAIAGVMLTGCATNQAPPAALSASQAQAALAKGKPARAIENAEAAVLAAPRDAAYRAVLGSAYLDSGRFASAATSFDDAMKLGDTSARTALSLALALAASGKQAEAVAVLNDHQGDIARSDLGLAFSLAGYPERGIAVLSDAIRGGENTAKTRQNLAYSYALAGRWKEARLMAAEDVPAGQVSDRIGEWAAQVNPGLYQARVAVLLGVPAGARDAGQPVALALNNNPSVGQLAAEASNAAPAELAPVAAPAVPTVAAASSAFAAPVPHSLELPPVGDAPEAAGVEVHSAPAARSETFSTAFAETPSAPSFAAVDSNAGVFLRAAPAKAAKASRPAKSPVGSQGALLRAAQSDGTHLVQLGSFASEAGAKRAWKIYVTRYPELAAHDMVVTEAVVKGKRYWRVSAAGFDRSSSSSMCGRVKTSGAGCFAWAEGRPLPGAVDTGVRMALR